MSTMMNGGDVGKHMRNGSGDLTPEQVAEYAKLIRDNPGSHEVETIIDQAVSQYGEGLADAIANVLTKSESFPQSVQDHQHTLEISIAGPAIRIVSLDAGNDLAVQMDLFETLCQLIASDFWRIPREAHLTRVEREVWGFYLQGKEVDDMLSWVLKPNGQAYHKRGLEDALNRAIEKVKRYPALGWRTCLAEDWARGRYTCRKPLTVSVADLARQYDEST